MSNQKISQLPSAAKLSGTERIAMVQSGSTKRGLTSAMLRRRSNEQRGILHVMSTPPVLAYGGQAAVSMLNGNAALTHTYSTLASPGTDASPVNTTGPFRWTNFPAVGGTTYPNSYLAQADGSKITAPFAEPCYGMEFDLYGDAFEFGVKGLFGLNFQIFVDDQPIQLDPTVPTALEIPNDGFPYRIKVTFADVGIYRIKLEAGIQTHISGIDLAAGHDIMYPSSSGMRPRCVFFGDSYVAGAAMGVLEGPGSPGMELGRVLGWDVISSGYGATGYLTAPTFRSRVQNDIIDLEPDVVVILGGLNDQGSYTPSQIATEATLLLTAIRTGLPDAEIYLCGIDSPSGPNGFNTPIKDALEDACDAMLDDNIHFIDILPVFTRAYPLISGDNTHPTSEGYRWLGRYIAARIQ